MERHTETKTISPNGVVRIHRVSELEICSDADRLRERLRLSKESNAQKSRSLKLGFSALMQAEGELLQAREDLEQATRVTETYRRALADSDRDLKAARGIIAQYKWRLDAYEQSRPVLAAVDDETMLREMEAEDAEREGPCDGGLWGCPTQQCKGCAPKGETPDPKVEAAAKQAAAVLTDDIRSEAEAILGAPNIADVRANLGEFVEKYPPTIRDQDAARMHDAMTMVINIEDPSEPFWRRVPRDITTDPRPGADPAAPSVTTADGVTVPALVADTSHRFAEWRQFVLKDHTGAPLRGAKCVIDDFLTRHADDVGVVTLPQADTPAGVHMMSVWKHGEFDGTPMQLRIILR